MAQKRDYVRRTGLLPDVALDLADPTQREMHDLANAVVRARRSLVDALAAFDAYRDAISDGEEFDVIFLRRFVLRSIDIIEAEAAYDAARRAWQENLDSIAVDQQGHLTGRSRNVWPMQIVDDERSWVTVGDYLPDPLRPVPDVVVWTTNKQGLR